MEVLDSENGLELISSPQMRQHVRRRVVIKALTSIEEELTASAQRSALQPSDRGVMPIGIWSVGPNISQAKFEEAVIAINAFSRCALLLTVFEGLSLDDVAELLHCDRELIGCGREAGLWQLTRSLGSIAPVIPPQRERTIEAASLR